MVIDTGSVSNVVAVPTSAVETTGNRSYVLVLDNGILARKVIKIGMIGDTYTQVVSGLKDGQSVILADYAEAVPSSNTDLTTALGGGGRLRRLGRLRRRAGGFTRRRRLHGAGAVPGASAAESSPPVSRQPPPPSVQRATMLPGIKAHALRSEVVAPSQSAWSEVRKSDPPTRIRLAAM